MNRKLLAGTAAALTLAAATAAQAQVLITEPTYVVEPAPVYSEPLVVAPNYWGPGYATTSSYVQPRYSYTLSTPARAMTYDAAYYSAPVSCSIDIFGIRHCY
jgi:hypothetical protein